MELLPQVLEYFDKSVNDLSYEEAALLAALPKGS